jgi:hypothetical protein
VRWLSTYLHGRQACTLFRDVMSTHRIVRSGVPQGSVISPTLFNFYVSDAPTPIPPMFIISYADDFTILAIGTDIEAMTRELNEYLATLSSFLENRKMELSVPKCSVTLFTPDSREHKKHPEVMINGNKLRLEKTPKLLGVTFDTGLTFAAHCKAASKKTRSRTNIIRALSGTTWGQSKETLLVTFLTIARPVAEYAAPVWTPTTANSNIDQLQTAQNTGLRIATGCTRMASIDHLHQETKVLPVRRHIRMRSVQMQLAHHLPDHPGYRLLQRPVPPREMKATLRSRYERYIVAIRDDDSDEDDLTEVLRQAPGENSLRRSGRRHSEFRTQHGPKRPATTHRRL